MLLKRLGAFLLPFIVFPGLPLGIALGAGELTTAERVVERQASGPLLYGRAYRASLFSLKLIATQVRRPRILVIGSSRVMQLRGSRFKPGEFYNAGGGASSMVEALEFVRRLSFGPLPRVILIGIDQAWLVRAAPGPVVIPDERVSLQSAVRMSHLVTADLIGGKISITRVLTGTDPFDDVAAVGMNAIMTGSGFRSDGSYQYGTYRIRWPSVEERLSEGFERIRQNVVPMSRAETIDPDALNQLRELLRLAHQRGALAIGFSPPFAPTILRAMRDDGGYSYMSAIQSEVGLVFDELGYRYVDFSNPAALGATDDQMIDYFHPSEVVMDRLYGRLVAADARLAAATGGT